MNDAAKPKIANRVFYLQLLYYGAALIQWGASHQESCWLITAHFSIGNMRIRAHVQHLFADCIPIVLVVALGTGCERSAPPSIAESTSPDGVVLLNAIGDQVWPFKVSQDKVKVFVFVRSDCPISNRYAPEVRRLFQLHSPDEVVWWLVYPNPHASAEQIENHLAEFSYPCPGLRDSEHHLVRMTGAAVTPEAVVYDRRNNLVYCGRIDDRYVDFGRERPAPTTHDLEDAIDAALAGRAVEQLRTEAVGCYIRDIQ